MQKGTSAQQSIFITI